MRHLEKWIKVGAMVSILVGVATNPLPGAVCAVPGDFSTIGEAVAAVSCTEVSVQAGTFVEQFLVDRDLVLYGAGATSTTLQGRLDVQGSGVEVTLRDLTVDVSGCFPTGVSVGGGAQVHVPSGQLRVVDSGPGPACPLFRDGFETGGVARWSASSP